MKMTTGIVSTVLAAAVLACGGREESHSTHQTATTTTTPSASVPYDLMFLDTMTKHHQGAVDMARVAAGRIQHPELRKLVMQIPVDQEREIKQMKAWRDQWYPGSPSAENTQMPGMKQSHMDTSHMQSMPPGKEYDAMFIDMMIPHHEGAVTMSQEALAEAAHEEVRTLAGAIIDAQTREIRQMKAWRSQLGG